MSISRYVSITPSSQDMCGHAVVGVKIQSLVGNMKEEKQIRSMLICVTTLGTQYRTYHRRIERRLQGQGSGAKQTRAAREISATISSSSGVCIISTSTAITWLPQSHGIYTCFPEDVHPRKASAKDEGRE